MPFLLIFAGTIGIYSLINWYYILQPLSDVVSEDYSNFWIPFLLPIIPVFLIFHFIIRPEKPTRGNLTVIYIFATICISPSTIISQYFLDSVTGKMTELKNIGEIDKYPKSKYYSIRDYFVDQQKFSSTSTSTMVNAGWNLHIFVVTPIRENRSDTTGYPKAWLAKTYFTNIGRLTGLTQREKEEKSFLEDSYKDFKNTNLNDFKYLERIPCDLYADTLINTVKSSPLYKKELRIDLLFSRKNEFDDRYTKSLLWLIFSVITSNGAFLALLYFSFKKYPKRKLINKF